MIKNTLYLIEALALILAILSMLASYMTEKTLNLGKRIMDEQRELIIVALTMIEMMAEDLETPVNSKEWVEDFYLERARKKIDKMREEKNNGREIQFRNS